MIERQCAFNDNRNYMRTMLINICSEHHGDKVKFSFINPLYKRTEYEAINCIRPLLDGKDFLSNIASFTNFCIIYKIASNTNCIKYSSPILVIVELLLCIVVTLS